jgi:bifunctional non-homologous end joining protein LigD
MSGKIAEIEGKRLVLSNLEKDLYPGYGFTKAHVLDYYRRIAPFILPHLKNRALTMKRYPNGVDKESFYEKRCPSHRPPWLETADITNEGGESMRVCLVNDQSSLLWVENLASIELHVPLARASSPGTPDSLVFDLDPGEGAGILECARVALILRDLLEGLGLSALVKTSGRKGLHVYVPLNHDGTTFDDTKKFTKATAELLQGTYPDLVTSKMPKDLRKKKVFINWSQNDRSKTMACVYSLRAGDKPCVSSPLSWKEVEDAPGRAASGMLEILHLQALKRAEKKGDLFMEMLTKKQKLPFL